MHVGIIAACLPTLKPLFATFFGQIRTTTRGHATSSGISAPFKSNGYIQHRDNAPGSSNFAMTNLSEGSQTRSGDPYDENIMLGKETYSGGKG